MSFQDLEAGTPMKSRRNPINGKKDSTQAVASGIFQINTAVSTFHQLVNTLGTPKDTPELRDKLTRQDYILGSWEKILQQNLRKLAKAIMAEMFPKVRRLWMRNLQRILKQC